MIHLFVNSWLNANPQASASFRQGDRDAFRRSVRLLIVFLILTADGAGQEAPPGTSAPHTSALDAGATQPSDGLSPALLDDLPLKRLRRAPTSPNPLRDGRMEQRLPAATSPLTSVGRKMSRVSQGLRSRHPSETTQQLQMEIIQQLDRLIASVDQQQSSTGGSTQADSVSQETTDGGPGSLPGAMPPSAGGPLETLTGPFRRESVKRYWGHLPDQVQQQIQTPLHEDFLPSYRGTIADYYERLSQQEGR